MDIQQKKGIFGYWWSNRSCFRSSIYRKKYIKGIEKGIDKGRVEGNSTDEAIIILDQKAFNEYIDCTILSVEKTAKYYEIKVGLKNKSKETVRLANLSEKKCYS